MSETLVVTLTLGISYGLIIAYAVYLHMRRRKAGS